MNNYKYIGENVKVDRNKNIVITMDNNKEIIINNKNVSECSEFVILLYRLTNYYVMLKESLSNDTLLKIMLVNREVVEEIMQCENIEEDDYLIEELLFEINCLCENN